MYDSQGNKIYFYNNVLYPFYVCCLCQQWWKNMYTVYSLITQTSCLHFYIVFPSMSISVCFVYVCVCMFMPSLVKPLTCRQSSWYLSCLWTDIILSASHCSFQNTFVQRSEQLRLMSVRTASGTLGIFGALCNLRSPQLTNINSSCPAIFLNWEWSEKSV